MLLVQAPTGTYAKAVLGNDGNLYPLNASNQATVPFKVAEPLVPAGFTVISVTHP